ncbi:microtubule-associated tumor suppressor 1 homolog A isoform X4 [Tachysurus fulvidraco]|uniref:microtubule-associated tumor suppressor 1 homolog A isoform X4 n=1 Tax=Tachysurus fulvidraco TaxID=1234273 RepID=UPI001FEF47AC|nr:microtubule-associated tumor suppressor 1 homolog A isoform X4 [Tachysurus fulvidraco]
MKSRPVLSAQTEKGSPIQTKRLFSPLEHLHYPAAFSLVDWHAFLRVGLLSPRCLTGWVYSTPVHLERVRKLHANVHRQKLHGLLYLPVVKIRKYVLLMLASGDLRSCTWSEFSSYVFNNSTLIPQTTAGSQCDLTLLTCLLIGSYRFCIIPLLAAIYGKSKTPLQRSDKRTASLSNASVMCAVSVSKPPVSSRPARLPASVSVDKTKAKGSSRSQQQEHANGHPDLVPPETKPRGLEYYKALCEKKNQTIQQLKNSLIASNRRFEAFAVVVQTLYIQNEESVKRRQEHTVELLDLHEELVNSVQSCERLEKEKEQLHAAFDGVLQKVQEQHRLDLADLEERLKTFYMTEWEKIQQSYQEEAEKYKALLEQQLEELRAKHEVMQKELEESHEENVKGLMQHYEESFKELRKSHEQEMQALEKMQKETESKLTNQIEELTTANSYFSERLKAEEDRRKELAETCQKDSHTLYLEQELESLKVVLDIKNKQIHQQDKKVMQIEKLTEKNVKLEECLKKVQQENEDLKARMDRHAALSRQLSTEQAVLQESLQKETKVNKRLSMENEELLWKLQNGDMSSPRKISPSSPSVTLQSPRHSGLFSSPPVSPR